MLTYEYIEKAIEAGSGFTAMCWRVTKVEIWPAQNTQVIMTLTGWKDIDAFLAGKAAMETTTVSFDHAEEMTSYPAIFGDLLTKRLSDPKFVGGQYKTKDVEEPV